MSTAVFHFGSQERCLLGTLHYTPRLRRRSVAVLLCNPMGEEAARAHRVYRVLATQLERAGFAVQRFDFFGTGDSGGDAVDASIATWQEDIGLAAAELMRLSGVGRVVLIGLRLGASLAALACDSNRLQARHLVLWDPVVDGASYLRELAAAHRAYMKDEMGEFGWRDRMNIDAAGVPGEALGTEITATLASGIAAIDLTAMRSRADNITVICTRESDEMVRLRENWSTSHGLRWLDIRESVAWNSDAALNSATVPIDIIQAIVARVEELSP